MKKINWSDSIWFFDIDDTLINTAESSLEASKGISAVLSKQFGEESALRVQNEFIKIFETMMIGHTKTNIDKEKHQDYDLIINIIDDLQREIKSKYGKAKRWSREVFLKIAADRCGVVLNPDLIKKSIDEYWKILSEISIVYPGVGELFTKIKDNNRPVYLLTGSDARLTYHQEGYFSYDPIESESFKIKRIEQLRQKGIDFRLVSVGDPEDKPNIDFFTKGIEKAEKDLGHEIDFSKAIMIGDSYAADLKVPKEELNFGLVALFVKNQSEFEIIIDEHQIQINNIKHIANFLK